MALFPCDYCGSRYRGAQQTVYPSLVHLAVSVREKRRACPACFDFVLSWCGEHLERVGDGSQASPEDCSFCGGEMENRIVTFVTLYAAHSDRADYWGQVCRLCTPSVGRALFGTEPPLDGLLPS